MSFRTFLTQAEVTDDPAGDLIADMRSDRDLPDVQDIRAARFYLRDRGACQGAIDALPDVWWRYVKWCARATTSQANQRSR
jgi:hypothetical protein